MTLSAYYTLTKQEVAPKHLMLDPNNPRLSLEWNGAKTYTADELCSRELQERVFGAVLSGKYRVSRLIESIREKGFVYGSQPMIVKRIGKRAKFLVLEGNRRTAAIRHLQSGESDLSIGVRKSIKLIPVQVFDYAPNPQYAEEDVIDILLGTIHVDGPEQWGAMEKAYYIYRAYARELVREKGIRRFRHDVATAEAVGKHFNMTKAAVRKALGVYRVFQQLRSNKYDVNADDYSLIDMAISRNPAHEFFLYDTNTLKMALPGLERFSAACLERDSPVCNPQAFSAFNYVLRNGTEYEVQQIMEERKDAHEVKVRTRQRVQKRAFVERLDAIRQDIEKLKPTDFRGTQEERQLITRVHELVEGRLLKLVGDNGYRARSTKAKRVTKKRQR